MNPRSVDLRQLRYFVAVAEELNFRRAAERLHLTQPPLSRQIADLEAALGVTLLKRDTRSVALTPAGEAALREFRTLLATFDAALERVARAKKSATRRLRFGMLYWSDLMGLAGVEEALRADGLVGGIEVLSFASHESIAALKRGALDAALVVGPLSTQGMAHVKVGEERHAAFVPAKHPLAKRNVVALNDLKQLPAFFRFRRADNPALYDHFARQYAAAGFRHPEEAQAVGVMGLLAQIAAGRGGTIMPRTIAAKPYPGVRAIQLREAVTVDLELVVADHVDARLRAALLDAAPRLAAGARAAPASVTARNGAGRKSAAAPRAGRR